MGAASQAKAALESAIETVAADIASHCDRPGADFTRRRKCGAADVLSLLVWMGSDTMGRECRAHFAREGLDPAGESAVLQQRKKMLPSAPREVVRLLTSWTCREAPLWKGRWRLVAVDGTALLTQRGSDPATANKGKAGSRGYNSMYATCAYDAMADQFLDAVIVPEPDKDEPAAFRRLVAAWDGPRETVWVADRGFASYNDFAHVLEAGMRFAVRVKDSFARTILGAGEGEALPDMLDRDASLILSRSRAARKRSRPERGADYRFVSAAMKLDFITEDAPEYDLALRIVRFPMGDGTFANVATDLGAGEAGAADIAELYGRRWDIETAFRFLKHTIGASRLHSGRPRLAEQEIWGRLALYDFCAAVIAAVAADSPPGRGALHERAIDFTNAAKECMDWLRGMGPPEGPEDLMSRMLQPIRPGRSYARHGRLRSPESFGYRPA